MNRATSYCIQNVEIWTEQGTLQNHSLWISEGRLKKMGSEVPDNSQTVNIDGRGFVLLPSGVDAQVHLRVPGQSHKEKPETGLLAALKGGYSALLTMPNTQPTIDSVEVLRQGQAEVKPFEEKYGVRVLWSAAITKRLNSDDPTDYEALAAAGVRAFTNDGLGVLSDQVMEHAFSRLSSLGLPLLQHAEFLGHGGSLAPGPVQARVGATPYPDEPEWKMVERDLRELEKHPNAHYHVLHVSSRRTLDFLREAKSRGLKVTGEVTPHHLFFNTETLDPENLAFKMNPPIRSKEDQVALWQALADGTLDFVATDHAPHEATMKVGHFDSAAFGTLGLETTLYVLLDGLNRGLITKERLVQVFSSQPARFLGLESGYGGFAVGQPFHAVLINVNAGKRRFSIEDISSLSKNSCFVGAELPGRIETAFHGDLTVQF